jgi:hypothetical protein
MVEKDENKCSSHNFIGISHFPKTKKKNIAIEFIGMYTKVTLFNSSVKPAQYFIGKC